MLSHRPLVAPLGPPDAADVRAAKSIVGTLARAAGAPTAQPVTLDDAALAGTARVLADGLPRMRTKPRIVADGVVVDAALRIAANTWLNGRLTVVEQPAGGHPDISARIGAIPVPAPVFELAARGLVKAIAWRAGAPLPSPAEALPDLEARGDHVIALVDLPQGLLRTLGRAVPDGDAVDAALVERLYARALARFDRRPVDLGDVYAVMFADAPRSGDAARDHARAAVIAAAMVSVGPEVRRLAGRGGARPVEAVPAILNVTLAGRQDLAKHFTLSAALAVSADPELGRALGTWKELDDSLAGGSGFSFIDLAADRAGLRFGERAATAAGARHIIAAFAEVPSPMLLPLGALGFEEGIGERDFVARFGNIATEDYAEAVARIDAALDALPVMR